MTANGQRADAVFEGGGVKGIGLVGALQAFEEAGFQWQNVAGTSAGAITAALVAVGYTAQETKMIMNERVDFHKFMDTAGIGRLPVLGPWLSLISTARTGFLSICSRNKSMSKAPVFVRQPK